MGVQIFGEKGWTPKRIGRLKGKTYLITGASCGAGFEAARILLSKGAEVVMLNRSESRSVKAISKLKAELGAKTKVSFIRMDLSAYDTVRNAAEKIIEKVTRINALICNDTVSQIPSEEFNKYSFERQFALNHYGHFLLCGLLFNVIEASLGRIVVVGSEGYRWGLKKMQFADVNWNDDYHRINTCCHDKLLQMMFAYELQDRIRMADKQVKVYVCHPGYSTTSLTKNNGGLERVVHGFLSNTPLVQSAEKGAYPEVMCATEVDRHLDQKAYYGPTGRLQFIGPVGECKLDPHVRNKWAMKKLWCASVEATGFKWEF